MFLGAAGFYRKFIRNFASITAPLTELTKLSQRAVWQPIHTEAWKTLQKCLTTYPILKQPDPSKEFIVDTDASNVGIGAVLLQRDEKGDTHPIAYASRKLTPPEQRFSTREQEALAILFAVDKFNVFILGRKFTVVTDHKSLSWLMTAPALKGRLLNWAFKLRSYDFTIVYRRGADNHMADMLSRLVNQVSVLHFEKATKDYFLAEQKRIATVSRLMQIRDNGVLCIQSKIAKIRILPDKPLSKKQRFQLEILRARNDEQKEICVSTDILPLAPSHNDNKEGGSDNVHKNIFSDSPFVGNDIAMTSLFPVDELNDGLDHKHIVNDDVGNEDKMNDGKISSNDVKVHDDDVKMDVDDKKSHHSQKLTPRQGLLLTDDELREARTWDIPNREGWKTRTSEDLIFGPILAFLEGQALKDGKNHEKMTEISKNYASVEGLLVARRVNKQEGTTRLVVLVPNGLRTLVISQIHDTDHRGVENTLENLRLTQKWWPGITQDVSIYVECCIFCAILKAQGTGKGLLVGWGIEPRKLQCIHIDYTGPLRPTAEGYRYVLSIVDRASGWIELAPTPRCTSEEAIKMLLNVWIPRYGAPKIMVADRGTHFTSQKVKEVTEKLGVKIRPTTSYHPQTNGVAERRFRDLGKAIKIFAAVEKEWDKILPQFMFSTRNIPNSVTGFSPATILFGEPLRNPLSMDGNYDQFADQGTELKAMLNRQNLVENVISDKKLALFQRSHDKAIQRFQYKPWKVGQDVFVC